MSLLQKIIESLNIDHSQEEPRSELITLYHADAEQVSNILQDIIGASTKNTSRKNSPAKTASPAPKPASSANPVSTSSVRETMNGNFSEDATGCA